MTVDGAPDIEQAFSTELLHMQHHRDLETDLNAVTEAAEVTTAEVVAVGAPVLYRADFTFETPGLEDGIEVYTPEIGDVLIEASWFIGDAWDGTTPIADVGIAGATTGLFGAWSAAVDLANLSLSDMTASSGTVSPYNSAAGASLMAAVAAYVLTNTTVTVSGDPESPYLNAPEYQYGPLHRFEGVDPLLVWASQDGELGGDAVGGTGGTCSLYLLIARPIVVAMPEPEPEE